MQAQPVLLTGDHENAAHAIADTLGIRDARANCLPEDKLNFIDEYQKSGSPICMIGDGINDAPALKKGWFITQEVFLSLQTQPSC